MSEEPHTSVLMLEDGGCRLLRNNDNHLPYCKVPQFRVSVREITFHEVFTGLPVPNYICYTHILPAYELSLILYSVIV